MSCSYCIVRTYCYRAVHDWTFELIGWLNSCRQRPRNWKWRRHPQWVSGHAVFRENELAVTKSEGAFNSLLQSVSIFSAHAKCRPLFTHAYDTDVQLQFVLPLQWTKKSARGCSRRDASSDRVIVFTARHLKHWSIWWSIDCAIKVAPRHEFKISTMANPPVTISNGLGFCIN